MASRWVRLRFRSLEAYEAFETSIEGLQAGDRVVAATERGTVLGTVVGSPLARPPGAGEGRKVLRRAAPEDLARAEENFLREIEAFRYVRDQIRSRALQVKVARVELALDGTRLTVLYSAAERGDLRDFGRELAQHFHLRVDMRQVGARDEARALGGVGPCGQVVCCARFLTSLKSIAVKMAKEQSFPSTPQRINGVCGRLKCCLAFEVGAYVEGKRSLPPCGARCNVARGEGRVVAVDPLGRNLTLEFSDGKRAVVPAAEIKSS